MIAVLIDAAVVLGIIAFFWWYTQDPCKRWGHLLVPAVTQYGADCLRCKKFFPMEVPRP